MAPDRAAGKRHRAAATVPLRAGGNHAAGGPVGDPLGEVAGGRGCRGGGAGRGGGGRAARGCDDAACGRARRGVGQADDAARHEPADPEPPRDQEMPARRRRRLVLVGAVPRGARVCGVGAAERGALHRGPDDAALKPPRPGFLFLSARRNLSRARGRPDLCRSPAAFPLGPS